LPHRHEAGSMFYECQKKQTMLVLNLAKVERRKRTTLGKPEDKMLSAGGNSPFLDHLQHPRI